MFLHRGFKAPLDPFFFLQNHKAHAPLSPLKGIFPDLKDFSYLLFTLPCLPRPLFNEPQLPALPGMFPRLPQVQQDSDKMPWAARQGCAGVFAPPQHEHQKRITKCSPRSAW